MAAFGEFTPGTVNVRVKTPGGTLSFDLTDFGPYPLWSTVTLGAAQGTEITYFASGRGSVKPGAGGTVTNTKLDTNLEASNGTLGASDEMLVWSLRLILPSDITLADIKDITKKTYTGFYIAIQKPSIEGRVEMFPAGGGIDGVTTQNAAEKWTNGSPQSSAGRVLASPHYLGGITPFYARQEFPTALALSGTRDCVVVIDGLRRRPVG